MTTRRMLLLVTALASLASLSACGRDREVRPLAAAPGEPARVDLVARDLKTHDDFDALDRRLMAGGGADELLKVYDDLARLAPEDSRLLVRGALAALAADPEQRGPAVAEGVLQRLQSTRGTDPDVGWLWLRSRRLALSPAGQPLKARDDAQAEAAATLAADARAFAAAHPEWKGPFGATGADALRTATEAEGAVAARAVEKAAPAPDAGAPAGAAPAPEPRP